MSTKSAICLSISGLGSSKSINDLCSLALAFSPSQSSLDQSECTGEGCGASYLQYKHASPKHSHALLGVGCIILILFKSVEFVSNVLNLLVLIGLN